MDSRPARFQGCEIYPLSIAGPVRSSYVGDICDQFSGLPFGHIGHKYFPLFPRVRPAHSRT